MTEVIILPWGRTDWADQGRLIGATNLPLNEHGRIEVTSWASMLASSPPDKLQYGPEEAGRETTSILARRLHIRHGRPSKQLREPSLGLWEGLTVVELEQRFTSAYEDWRGSPESFCPPEGEPVADAAERLHAAAERVLRKDADERVLFVVGPMAAALLRCKLAGEPISEFWTYLHAEAPMWRLKWPPAGAGGGPVEPARSA